MTETDDETPIEEEEIPAEEAEVLDTESAESLDEVHAMAAYNRAVMGPEANDPSIPTPGTEVPVEPGPGPEDNEALDNATGGALSNAAESGASALYPGPHESFANRGELAAKADANLGIGVGGEEGAEEGEGDYEDDEFDPADHNVAEVQEFIAAHPELEEDVLEAERAGKNRSSITG